MHTKKTFLAYLAVTLFLFGFQLIYHYFGHGVYSLPLRYCWLIPLIGGSLFLILHKAFHLAFFQPAFLLFNFALATLSTWAILTGILEIAGSDSPYLQWYLIASAAFLITSFILTIWHKVVTRAPCFES